MQDQDLNLDELATSVFLARHLCARDPLLLTPESSAEQASLLMQLHDQDQAPVACTNGRKVARRLDLEVAAPGQTVANLAINTPAEHWIDDTASLHDALEELAEHDWLLVGVEGDLLGTINRQDLARPVISAYLISVILGLERGLRRLYGSYASQPIPDEPKAHSHAQSATQLAEDDKPDTFDTTTKYVCSCKELVGDLNFSGSKKAKSALYRIKQLRNHLAHARSVLEFGETPVETLNRIRALEALASTVRHLLLNRDAVWNAYSNTKIVSGRDLSIVFAGCGATSISIPEPVHVISAQNPHEQFLGESENARRTIILQRYLQLTSEVTAMEKVIGLSANPDAAWQEESWAVSGLTREQAIEIARCFQQRAIFELTAAEMIIVPVDGSNVLISPRRLS